AANRADTTVATYLVAARQAEAFLRGRGKTLSEAGRADPEAFMGDLLARRTPSWGCCPDPRLRGSCLVILPLVLLVQWRSEGVVSLIAGARLIIGSFRAEGR